MKAQPPPRSPLEEITLRLHHIERKLDLILSSRDGDSGADYTKVRNMTVGRAAELNVELPEITGSGFREFQCVRCGEPARALSAKSEERQTCRSCLAELEAV